LTATPVTFTCKSGGLMTIDANTGRGTVTVTLTTPAGFFSSNDFSFTFYVINATKVVFISNTAAGAEFPVLGGVMFQQNPAKAGSFGLADLACGFGGDTNTACIFASSGESSAGSHVSAGRALGTGAGMLNLLTDDNNAKTVSQITENGATVTVNADGSGIIRPPAGDVTDSPVGFVLIDTDSGLFGVANDSVQVGAFRPQTVLTPAAGSYTEGSQLVANGKTPNSAGNLAVTLPPNGGINGAVNVEQAVVLPPTSNIELSGQFMGTYNMDSPATGRGTGATNGAPFVIYAVGPKEFVILEADTTNPQPVLFDFLLQ